MIRKISYYLLFIHMSVASHLDAQFAYGWADFQLYGIDLTTCTKCPLFSLPSGGSPDVTVLPDGRVIYSSGSQPGALVFNSTGAIIGNIPISESIQSSTVHNGSLYCATSSGLYIVDLATNAPTFIGAWASGMPTLNGLYSLNGNLYSREQSNSGPFDIWTVNIANPSLSTFLQFMPTGTSQARGVSASNGLGYYCSGFANGNFGIPNAIWSYDQASNTSTQVCQTGDVWWGLSVLPVAVAPFVCPVCVPANVDLLGGPYQLCNNNPLNASPAFNIVQPSGYLLQYFLVTDPTNIPGSIVATNSTPTFAFVSTGINYYLVAAVGPSINGSLDLTSQCTDISAPILVRWNASPSITFAISQPDICAGACTDVTYTATGVAPFVLTYTIDGVTNQTANLITNTGIFQICTLQNSSVGLTVLQSLSLSDSNCICEP